MSSSSAAHAADPSDDRSSLQDPGNEEKQDALMHKPQADPSGMQGEDRSSLGLRDCYRARRRGVRFSNKMA